MQRFVHKVVSHHHHHHQPNPSYNISRRIFHTSGGSAHIHTPKRTQLGYPLHHFHSWPSSQHHTLSTKIRSCLSQPIIALNSRRRISLLDCRPRLHSLHFSAQRFIYNRNYGSYRRQRDWRSWFDSVPPQTMVWALIRTNAVIYVLWGIVSEKFMRKNFTLTLDNLKSGRLYTLITNAFSHVDFGHIFVNMLGLYFFGTHVGMIFGSGFLLRLYLAGALCSAYFYLVHYSKGWRNINPSAEGLGASGAMHAVVLFQIFLHIPVPLVWLVSFWIGKDILAFVNKEGMNTSNSAAYMGGGAVAAIAWARVRRGIC